MFDSGEIAARALLRAEKIKEERKRRRALMQAGGALLCVCIATAFIVSGNLPSTIPGNTVVIEDDFIPMGAPLPPDTGALPTDTGALPNGTGALPYTEMEQTGAIYTIPGYDSVWAAAGGNSLDMVLYNPEGNAYLFSFEIILEDTGETIYESGLVEPGFGIGSPALENALRPGEYSASLIIGAYGPENHFRFGTSSLNFTIIVE